MQVLSSAGAMYEKARGLRAEGKRLGLVPTMGMFHEGHLGLMRCARRENDVLTVSLFVNPTQFSPGEDFESYPRNLETDLRKAEEEGIDLVFMPGIEEIYPPGDRTFIEVKGLSDVLCGERRPGHFRGVTTVVAKLFTVCLPHRAYFGKKDFQQWIIIRQMVSDLRMDVEIVGCPTVREKNGLAHSSRNFYLDDEDRAQAIGLRHALLSISEGVQNGCRDALALMAIASKVLEGYGLRRDYLAIVHPETLLDLDKVTGPAVALGAVWCGKARLIDNLELD